MNIQIINPITYPNWDDMLLEHSECSFFHTSHWARVLNEAYGYKPLYFSVIENGRLRSLIPVMEVDSFLTGKRGVSLPFTDYCEPVKSDESEFHDMFKYISEHSRRSGWKYLELRGGETCFKVIPPSSYYYGHTLELSSDTDRIFSHFGDSTKRNIKKAQREGVTVYLGKTLHAVSDFYDLNCLTRKMHGLPSQPFSFFEKIYRHVLARDQGIIVSANYRGKTIASAIYFHFGKKAVYKYGASDREHQQLRANNLVMWEAIRYYAENAYSTLCFGRTDTDHEGLLRFKEGWGTEQNTINYYMYDLQKESFVPTASKVNGFHNKVFSRMPVPLLNFAGSMLYKHIG